MQVTRELFNDVMVPNYNPAAMIPVRGVGSKIWDQDDKEYIDFAGGIVVHETAGIAALIIAFCLGPRRNKNTPPHNPVRRYNKNLAPSGVLTPHILLNVYILKGNGYISPL